MDPVLVPSSRQAALGIRVAFGRLRRRMREVSAEDNGLTALQAGVLGRLGKGEAASASDLAVLEGVRPQTMATAVSSLEGLGLIARAPHPTDGRRQLLTLTEEGRAVESGSADARGEWLAHAMDERLTEQERQTLIEAAAVLEKLARP